jgi:hypothetical protein
MKLDLLTNATVVDDAIRFVSQKSKNLQSSTNSDEDQKESNEHDYNEDKDQLEEIQEEEIREITTAVTTTNHIF